MYSHRVLPLLPSLAPITSSVPAGMSGSSLLTGTMAAHSIGSSNETIATRRTSLKSSSSQGNSTSNENNRQPSDTGPNTNMVLTRKRAASQGSSPMEDIQHTESAFPRYSPSAIPNRPIEKDSPSQVCLCQPDPKVPRPRNGNKLSLSIPHMNTL
jgi:hypothetical protein